jgi:hypothetical protein
MAEARWILWSDDVVSKVVNMAFFPDIIDGVRRIWVNGNIDEKSQFMNMHIVLFDIPNCEFGMLHLSIYSFGPIWVRDWTSFDARKKATSSDP